MTTVFGALENRAFREFERVFGEAFDFHPYAAAPGGGRRGPDASRSVKTDVIGIYDGKPFKSTEIGTEARGSTPARLDRVHLNFDAARFPENLPQQFDRFLRKATGELLEVSAVERDGEGRLKLNVKSLGFQTP